ncbi:MAG TPA: hypothetical protein VF071_00715 [Candidatus Limnocylindria bacterium]
MNLLRLLRPRDASSWQDGRDEPLVGALRALAAEPVDVAERVERSRPGMREAFVRINAARAPSRGDWRGTSRLRTPRLAPALVAGILLVGLAIGGVAASGPGEPMYPLRLGMEELLLPAEGPARLRSQLDRLDRRLDEATGALGSGDTRGAEAAIRAFERIATQLASGAPPSGDMQASADRLSLQIRRLERLLSGTPLSDRTEALDAGARALHWLHGNREGDSPPPSQATPSPAASGHHGPAPTPVSTGSGGSQVTHGPSSSPGGNGPSGPTSSGQSSDPAGPRHSPEPTGNSDR